MKHKHHWAESWEEATRRKTPAERRAALEVFLDAPFEVLLRFARMNRKSVLRRLGPLEVGDGRSYYFAASRRKNILQDVVYIYARSSRRKVVAEEILVCSEVIIGRIPNNCYWVREIVRAAAGSVGGYRVINVNEFIGGVRPDFIDDFKCDLPRLKMYKFRGRPVRCVWSARELQFRSRIERLRRADVNELAAILKELDTTIRSVNADQEAEPQLQELLRPVITPLLLSPLPSIQLWANRLWSAVSFGITVHKSPVIAERK